MELPSSNLASGEYLAKYCVDLTELAKQDKLDPVIGRDFEIRRTLQILARRTKNNPVLIGEPGTGKTAIVEGLAQRIISGDVPESIKNNRVVSLDLAALIAGSMYRGEYEERLKGVLRDIRESKIPIILFIDEVHTLVDAGSAQGSMGAAQLLKPSLARGELHCIGATTLSEYRKYIEKDAALARRFQSVLIAEPNVEDAITILRGLKPKYELHHGVRIADSAIIAACVNSNRFISDRFLPDKAIDLVDEAASRLRLQQESKPEVLENLERQLIRKKMELEALKKETDFASRERRKEVENQIAELSGETQTLTTRWMAERSQLDNMKKLHGRLEAARTEALQAQRHGNLEKASRLLYETIPDLERQIESSQTTAAEADRMLSDVVTERHIAKVISGATGIPFENLLSGEREKLLSLEKILEQKVVGQSEAVSAVANTIRVARAGLQSRSRPLGSFMFLGGTGCGKTELCKVLAEFLFDSREALVRIDMSEYMERFAVSRLIGAPPGYVGYEEAGQLTEPVRRRPYSLVLFDEIEKAHPEVANLLLQLLDDGRLTDSQGRVVDFKNTIIVMTSNLGSQFLAQTSDITPDADTKSAVMSVVRKSFPPEFLNRIDELIVFNKLSKTHLDRIVDIQIDQLRPMLADKQVTLELDSAARLWLAERAYDPIYGARPLKRCIQHDLIQPLSCMILRGELPPHSHVVISVDSPAAENLTFTSSYHPPVDKP